MGRARSTGTRGKTAERQRNLARIRAERAVRTAETREAVSDWLTRPRGFRGRRKSKHALVVETRETGADAIARARRVLRLGLVAYALERLWLVLAPLIFLGSFLLGLYWLGFFSLFPAVRDEFGIRWFWAVVYFLLLGGVLWLTVPPWIMRLRVSPPFRGLKRAVRRAYEGEQRPLSTLQDKPANKLSVYGEVLWHRERLRNLELLKACRLRLPSFSLSNYDPYALRGLVLVIFALGLVAQFVAPQARGEDSDPLLLSARFNLWLDPPAYTGLAPSLLPANLEETGSDIVVVPHASRLTGRITSPMDRELPVLALGGSEITTEADGDGGFAVDWLLDDPALHTGAVLSLELPGRDFRWRLATIPDEPPEISIRGPITETQRGSLDIAYEAQDDYGVIRVDLVLRREGQDFALTESFDSKASLATGEAVPEPETGLGAEQGTESETGLGAEQGTESETGLGTEQGTGSGQGATPLTQGQTDPQAASQAEAEATSPLQADTASRAGAIQEDQNTLRLQLFITETGVPELTDSAYPDLRAHPWAGFVVVAQLEAHDGGGNSTASDSQTITLPELRFTHPLARILVALRKRLNDGLLEVPSVRNHLVREIHKWRDEISTGNHLALLFAEARLESPTDLIKIRQVQDLFWAVARDLEEGEIESLEDRVRALMEQLREAIREGRSDEEIAALLEQLRQESMEYLRALREQAAARGLLGKRDNEGEQGQGGEGGLDPNDLFKEAQSLLDGGQRGDLLGLLDDLEKMLANPQFAEGEGAGTGGGAGGGEGEGEGESSGTRAFEQGRDLLDEQARILNETFRGRQDGTSRDPAKRDELGQAQRDLREGLGEYIRQGEEDAEQAGQAGMSDEARQNLDEATRAMEQAERSLQRGDFTDAEVWQRRALQNLRQGVAQHIADLREGEQDGAGGGGGQESARGRIADGITERTSDLTGETRSRAREILEQIRPRLQQADDSEERKYLERLLRRF